MTLVHGHTCRSSIAGFNRTDIARGADNNLWITYSYRQDIGRITPSGRGHRLPDPDGQRRGDGITAGPDGALWFGEFQSNKIGRITTAGRCRSTPLPSGGNPQYITGGPDGAVGSPKLRARRIGRIAKTGTITEFAIPGAGQGAEDIATGSDGNLWFTDPPSAGRQNDDGRKVTYSRSRTPVR